MSANDDHNSMTCDITFPYRCDAEKFYFDTPGSGFLIKTKDDMYHVSKTVENDRHAMYDLCQEFTALRRRRSIKLVYISHEYYTVSEDCEFKRRQEDCK